MNQIKDRFSSNDLFGKQIKDLSPSKLFIFASVVGIVSVFISFFSTHGATISQYFWFDTRDTGMDFFHSIEYMRGNHPYEYFHTLYPPLANLLFGAILQLIPDYTIDLWSYSFEDSLKMRNTDVDLRTMQAPLMAFILFIILCVLVTAVLVRLSVRKKREAEKWGLVFSCVLSYGMLSAFERGNIIILSWCLTMVFVLTYNHENRFIQEIGLISLALSAGLKLYPALYGLLLIQEKRFSQTLRAIIYGILCIVLPTLLLGEGLSGLAQFYSIFIDHIKEDHAYLMNYGAEHLTDTLLADSIASFYGINLSGKTVSAIALFFTGIVLLSSLFEKAVWKRLYIITAVILLLAPQSTYGMVFFLTPLLLLFRDEDIIRRSNLYESMILILFTVNLPFFYLPGIEGLRLQLYQLLFLLIMIKQSIRFFKCSFRKIKFLKTAS